MVDLSRFYIKHTNSKVAIASMPMHWKTCLREVYFGFKSDVTEKIEPSSDFNCFEGVEAYKFLLQVVCGLKSPMVGETEVFGQYKIFVDSFDVNSTEAEEVKKILVDIRNASKKIRSEHLINLGAQSYGSLLRKKISFNKDIHIIGAGLFVEDIIPWLAKKSEQIYIHSRDTQKSKSKKQLENLNHKSLVELESRSGTLVIAAPLTSDQIMAWMGDSNFEYIFDLRGTSDIDPLPTNIEMSNLNQFFRLIEYNKTNIEEKVERANNMILSILESKIKGQKLNPFGWDDICA